MNPPCDCAQGETSNKTSTTGIIIGIHIGVTCIIFCVLFLMFGYRGRWHMCRKSQEPLPAPQVPRSPGMAVQNGAIQTDMGETCNPPKRLEFNELETLVPVSHPHSSQDKRVTELVPEPPTPHDETQISMLPPDEFSVIDELPPESQDILRRQEPQTGPQPTSPLETEASNHNPSSKG